MGGFDRVRVRIAPSPTGDPHVGTAYMALFNYVFARKSGGDFVLRIEDTDRARARSTSEQMIFDTLSWLGLHWDEGPDKGGSYGPYRQSERAEIYREHVEGLIRDGHAYRCFCTAERLQEMRQKQKEAGQNPGYDRHCLDLSEAEVERQWKEGVPHVVRFKMPREGTTVVQDKLRGGVEFPNTQLDDQVLLKSDGFPTYHLANVVDDHLMKISHVIRAEEWVSSTPKHVHLYRAFGWEEPTWVHMPLLRNQDKSKISKRKNPTSISYYERAGILPEAMVNFLALMGWSYGDDQEVFTLEQMIERFELDQIRLGGPVFDQTKLGWLNNQYLQKIDDERFVSQIRERMFSPAYLKEIKPFAVERMERFEEFVDRFSFFFNGALPYDNLQLVPKGREPVEMRRMFKDLAERFDEVYEWTDDNIKATLDGFKQELGWKPKDFFMPIRLVVTGRKDSPPLVETMRILGREIVRFRLRNVLDTPQLKS